MINMKNVVIDFDRQSVEFKFMVTNRDVSRYLFKS